jgi:GNAT superfamily N-acetyltransferase
VIETEPLSAETLPDLARLFGGDRAAHGCWCMWFVIPVKAYHAGGAAANRAKFEALMAASAEPLGLIAYRGGEPVGWVAAGPRSRYVRAARTPTMRSTDRDEDGSVWLVPCFFVAADVRGKGIATALLKAAVEMASAAGAKAIEGFPLAGGKRQGADLQVGMEPVFAACGFRVVDRPSSNRVLMRREL